ncbi:DUF1799 domain-containing protein [Pseudomonas sp. zfem003]|uniref:DUF1799 domain-containing protein n=1 Tax=Pseudomonas sp. zfem003 TaxID=3078198 RepID=UPI00292886A3|nr:DUF1799 domain-containing protein [Pseudomonas sp. zfem003]MDU9398027.1 DUF1799 domain-containing protein [Pseudomonas sp. zfem003]
MAAWGLSAADVPAEEILIWPDVWPALTAFNCLSTQWRMGYAGPTGLDYSALEPTFRLNDIPPADWPKLFADIRVMERAALDTMHQKD